jgi:hypothetical protein
VTPAHCGLTCSDNSQATESRGFPCCLTVRRERRLVSPSTGAVSRLQTVATSRHRAGALEGNCHDTALEASRRPRAQARASPRAVMGRNARRRYSASRNPGVRPLRRRCTRVHDLLWHLERPIVPGNLPAGRHHCHWRHTGSVVPSQRTSGNGRRLRHVDHLRHDPHTPRTARIRQRSSRLADVVREVFVVAAVVRRRYDLQQLGSSNRQSHGLFLDRFVRLPGVPRQSLGLLGVRRSLAVRAKQR